MAQAPLHEYGDSSFWPCRTFEASGAGDKREGTTSRGGKLWWGEVARSYGAVHSRRRVRFWFAPRPALAFSYPRPPHRTTKYSIWLGIGDWLLGRHFRRGGLDAENTERIKCAHAAAAAQQQQQVLRLCQPAWRSWPARKPGGRARSPRPPTPPQAPSRRGSAGPFRPPLSVCPTKCKKKKNGRGRAWCRYRTSAGGLGAELSTLFLTMWGGESGRVFDGRSLENHEQVWCIKRKKALLSELPTTLLSLAADVQVNCFSGLPKPVKCLGVPSPVL